MQSLVLTLLSGTQKIQQSLQILAFLGFSLPHREGIDRRTFLLERPLNTQTLPRHPIDLDPRICFAVDYNFRHTYCYGGYHKRASFDSCL